MRRSQKAYPETLAAAVADGASIDWGAADAAAGANADLVRQLRVINAMRTRPGAVRALPRRWLRHIIMATYGVGVALATAKVLVATIGIVAALSESRLAAALWPFAANVVIFGLGGLLMVGGGTRDSRLQLLGGLYLTIASAFAEPFLGRTTGTFGLFVSTLRLCRPEAFVALGVWQFAWVFPTEPLDPRTRRLGRALLGAAWIAGGALFMANALRLQEAWPIHDPRAVALLGSLNRRSVTSFFWPLLVALSLPAVPYLIAKARLETPERRRQVSWFLAALALGISPILATAMATPFVPALHDPQARQGRGIVLDLALGSIVPMTAYSVVVNHVMDLQFVVRATLRYALARYAIWAAILTPITYLALDVFVNRGLTFLQYLDTHSPGGLIGLSSAGLVALTFRPQIVRAVDRWFHRELPDSPQALARLDYRFRVSEHLGEIGAALSEELTSALHSERVTVLLLSEDGMSLVALDATLPPIPRDSVLLDLLQSTRSEMHLDAASTVVRLLPDADQDWVAEARVQLLSPLIASSGTLLGVVAIGRAASELPYSDRHLALITTMCGHAALQLENRWLRQTRADTARSLTARTGGVAWQDEPAAWCPGCAELWGPDKRRCRCGAATKPAALPLFVNAKFRLQRVLGAGGTGIVYLATDLALDRQVAIKTLPPVRREYAPRLRREARAMASVRHPNLATIYGTEEWHETPFLVVEYLEGGTLLDWLTRGPLPVGEAIDLGIMLADALDRVHGSGVLHRDIKPSNIGYTADGVPKLLDFGLAAMLEYSKGPEEALAIAETTHTSELVHRYKDLGASSTLTATQHVVGTPLYLSPEALAGSAPRESFDLWGLGMVLYEAIAGRHPFGGRSVPEVVDAIQRMPVPDVRDVSPACPAAVATFLAAVLSPVPSRRPATASAFRADLRALRGQLQDVR